jgi:thiamine-phosphate pyrophosphorylase
VNALPDRLLIVTDRSQARKPLPAIIADCLAAGARWFWLRDRDLPALERAALAAELSGLVRAHGGSLSIGGDIALAAEVGAAGVHLSGAAAIAEARQRLGSGALIGLSAHSVPDVGRAAARGSDYVTLSPIYTTASKPGYGPALGTAAITAASSFSIPVLALGGIDEGRIADCMAAGAAGIAVMGMVMRAPAPRRLVAELIEKLAARENEGTIRAADPKHMRAARRIVR